MSDRAKLVMLGAAPETRGSVAAVVEAYRADGLFKRWPAEYIATCSTLGLAADGALLWRAVRRFGAELGLHPRAVVHVHLAPRAAFWRQCGFAALALGLRHRVVLQLHGGGYEGFYDRCSTPARAAIQSLLERAACVIVPCDALRAWVRRVSRDANVACVPVPVAIPQPATDAAARPAVVLSLGRLEADKGVFDLLDAMAQVRAAVPDARLVLAGEGDRLAVERYAEDLGIRDAVLGAGVFLADDEDDRRRWVAAGAVADSLDVVATVTGVRLLGGRSAVAALGVAGGAAAAGWWSLADER